MATLSSRAPSPDARVCPRCGEEGEPRGYCRTCGLNLWEQGTLPTRTEWESRSAKQPEAAGSAAGAGAGPPESSGGWANQPRWLRSLVEVGLPVAAVIAVAVIVFSGSGTKRRVPDALRYDKRAAPLLVSLRAARTHQLKPGELISAGGGGCSGSGSSWTCDLHVQQSKGGLILETYDVRWNQNGCWSAFEDCANPLYSAQRLCPPPQPVIMNSCISAAQSAATG